MSEKTPRLKPHTIIDIARVGDEYYHPPRHERPPLTPDQQRMAGQLSLMERAYPPTISRENDTSGVGWPE